MLRIDSVAVRVCRAARELSLEHPGWITIDHLYERLRHDVESLDRLCTVEAAVAFARAKGWLSISPGPADSVLLRREAP